MKLMSVNYCKENPCQPTTSVCILSDHGHIFVILMKVFYFSFPVKLNSGGPLKHNVIHTSLALFGKAMTDESLK